MSVISLKQWPPLAHTQESMTSLQGIGMAQGPLHSSKSLSWSDKKGHKGAFQPYVDYLPVNLWGRDVLAQMSVLLYSSNTTVAQMMLDQGHVPGTCLGNGGQGQSLLIPPQPHQEWSGLEYQPNLP